MAVVRVDVNPKVLEWAREKSGYALDTLPEAMRDNVKKWESGTVLPTWNQLIQLGHIYRRPSAFFLMSEPPNDPKDDTIDCRALNEMTATKSPNLVYEIRRAKERRHIALNLMESFGIRVNPFELFMEEKDPIVFAEYIRKRVGITVEDQFSWSSDRYVAFREWKKAIENLDVLIFETENVETDEIRGFCLSKEKYPIIVLNGKDSVNGRIFTLIHELVHLIRRNSALCDLKWKDRDEIFCNRVAGEFLVPEDDLLNDKIVLSNNGLEWEDEDIRRLSHKFKVSREVILRRLLIFGRTSNNFYEKKRDEWFEEFIEKKERKREKLREKNRNNQSTGIYQPPIIAKYNGSSFTRLVLSAYENGFITPVKFSDYMGGIKLKHIKGISELIHGGNQ